MANSDYTVRTGSNGFCPMGYLTADIEPLDTAVTMSGYTSPIADGIRIGMAAMIGDEIVVVTARSGNNLTLGRGCCDTVPASHSAGDAIWFFDDSIGSDRLEYAGTDTIGVKPLPRVTTGTLPIEHSPPAELSFNLRFARPYPPGLVEVNGDPWFTTPLILSLTDPTLDITWAHRDRITQQDQLIDHLEANIGPEAGTTYELRVYRANGDLLRTVVGETGTSWTYELADAISDFSAAGEQYDGYIMLRSMRDGLASYQEYRIDFTLKSSTEPPGAVCNAILAIDDAAANATLTNGDLTFTHSPVGATFVCAWVRGTSTRSGKAYWEVVNDGSTVRGLIMGIIKQSAWDGAHDNYPENPLYDAPMGLNAVCNGNFFGLTVGPITNGSLSSNSAYDFVTGDVIGFAVDFDAGKMWVSKNGTWIAGDPAAGTGETWSGLDAASDPYITTYNASGTMVATCHFTPSDFTYAAPAGFGTICSSDPSWFCVPDPHFDDVVLLLHGDGANGSTAIVDSSSYNKAVSITGSSAISTAQSKFGGSSIKGASASYITATLGSDGVFAGDFTIEMWINQSNNDVLFTSAAAGIYLYNSKFFYTGANSPSIDLPTITSGAWAHLAISRTAGVLKTFYDGVEQDSVSYSTSMDFSTIKFGYFQPNGNLHYQDYYDDIRITKNVGRYTSDFDPPAGPFCDELADPPPVIPDTTDVTLTLTTSLPEQPAGVTAAMNLTQLATPTSAGSAYVAIFYIPTSLQPDPVPAGRTISVSFGMGLSQSIAVETVLSYTTTAPTSQADIMDGLIAQANASTALSSRGLVAGANSYTGRPGMQISGPVGLKLHSTYGVMTPGLLAPVFAPVNNMLVVEFALGSPVVTVALNQLVTATLSGTPAAGDRVTVTLNGVAFGYTVSSGQSLSDIATALAALIDADSNYSAAAVGAVITIDGLTPTNVFSYSASSVALFAY